MNRRRLWPLGALLPTLLAAHMVAGGAAPRYVRLRPRSNLAAVLDERDEQALPDGVARLIARTTVEVLTLRPTLSLGLGSPARQ